MLIVHCPGTLGLVPNVLSYIRVDSDIPTKFSSTDNAEPLVLTYLATIIVEPCEGLIIFHLKTNIVFLQ